MTADAAYKQLYPLQYLNKFLSQGIRPDGRPLLEGRPCTLQHGIIRCDSSCMVSIGATTCIATVKLQARIVFPNHGAGNNIQAQSRRLLEDAAVATHRLQHALRACIDPAQLCIQAGVAAWGVSVDVCVLDSAGGLLDASLMASIAALQHCSLPAVDVSQEGRLPVVQRGEPGRRLRVTPAAACSVAWLPPMDDDGDKVMVLDPTAEEMVRAVGTAVVVREASGRVLAVYNSGGCSTAHLVASCEICISNRLSVLPNIAD